VDKFRWSNQRPARRRDLKALDFYPWGHMKALVYTNEVDSEEVFGSEFLPL
jgi:hypothetical protein